MWDNERIKKSAFEYLVKYAKLRAHPDEMNEDFLKVLQRFRHSMTEL